MPPPFVAPVGRNLVNQRKGAKTGTGCLPGEIKCFVCQRVKPRHMFANRQLQRLQDTIHNPYAPGGRSMKDPKTTCKTCTPQQTTELRCCICETTKGLQDFAKNQRKNPDVARCIECVQMHVGMEPGVDGPDCDSDVDSGDSDDSHEFDDSLKTNDKGKAAAKSRRRVAADPPLHSNEDENTPIGGSETASNFTETVADTDDDKWERVSSSATGNARAAKKNGWAKPAKASASKFGAPVKPEADIDNWDEYSRRLINRYSNKKPQTKTKAASISDDEW